MSSGTSAISLPKGGGAIKSIGETFQSDLFTGAGTFSLPIAILPTNRNDFEPKLELTYSSGHGNGPFGLGWQLSIPGITRKTEKGLPKYNEQDVFFLSGAEELVPCLDINGEILTEPDIGNYKIQCYRPRIEGLFSRIQRWTDKTTGVIHWRVTSPDNITSVYGRSENARVSGRNNPGEIYEWLLEETLSAKGDHIYYEYVKDNIIQSLPKIYEQNRHYSQTYIRRILYGNAPEKLDVQKKAICPKKEVTDHIDPASRRVQHYFFEVLFDYGDLPDIDQIPVGFDFQTHLQKSLPDETIRKDCFSNYRPGFELRTLRRCNRIMTLHHFNEGELMNAPLVKSMNFTYTNDKNTQISMLTQARIFGYRKDPDDNKRYLSKSMPPVSFKYSEFNPSEQHYQPVDAKAGDFPPSSLKDPGFALMDIHGDGLPDILGTEKGRYQFWQNRGEGQIDQRRSQATFPAGISLEQSNVAVGDVNGNGLPDLIIDHPLISGFYESTQDGSWDRFKKFESAPSYDIYGENARLVDLTGNGLSDILVTLKDRFLCLFCKGERGFDDPVAFTRIHDLELFPDIFLDDPHVRLADMTGDGLSDIVLVRDGNVCYWPNLGYGRFGERVIMENAPELDRKYDPARLLISDIDGSGCADLIYVDLNKVHFWFNQSGNTWSEKNSILGTPVTVNPTSIQVSDIYGSGTSCLLWSYDAGFQHKGNYKVLDFCGRKKPYLLIEMDNNLGVCTRVHYAPSTKFYLEDKNSGNPWLTNMPFPVQVVEKTEIVDHLNKTRFVTSYKYHHGYYDGREREFRGFGRVDQYDSEFLPTSTTRELYGEYDQFDNLRTEYHVPTVMTRSWFHTGACFGNREIGSAGHPSGYTDLNEAFQKEFYRDDLNSFPNDGPTLDFSPEVTINSAAPGINNAMKGALLRSEVYSLDDSDKASHPYVVKVNNYRIKEIQRRGKNLHSVLHRSIREAINYHYERNPDDPRIGHQINLAIDNYGNVTDTVSIAYPRRSPEFDQQGELKVLYLKSDFINKDESDFYIAGTLCQTRSLEITGLPGNRKLNSEDFDTILADLRPLHADLTKFETYFWESPSTPAGIKSRMVKWTRNYFRKNADPQSIDPVGNLAHRLPLGEIESLGLSYENHQAVFTDGMVSTIYSGRVDGTKLSEAGYVKGDSDVPGYWWIPSGRKSYNKDKFYLSEESRDPFDNPSRIEFDDYAILVKSIRDAVDNLVEAENDYRVIQPFRMKDQNDNHSEVVFDVLGMMVGTAIWGCDENGNPVGDDLKNFKPDLDSATIRAHLKDPLNLDSSFDSKPHNILQGATTRLLYDPFTFQETGNPNPIYAMARETHARSPGGNNCRIQHDFTYSDGFGREIQTKTLAEPEEGKTDLRWIASGSAEYNNKGNQVRKFEPFFSDSHGFKIEQHGVSTVLFYDPLERVITTLHPNGTYEKVLFNPWYQESWDSNDTILLTPQSDGDTEALTKKFFGSLSSPFKTWYEEAMNSGDPARILSANKAKKHANTPTVSFLNTSGRTFMTRQSTGMGSGTRIEAGMKLDIEGNLLSVRDPRNIETVINTFDMAGRKLKIDSKDAGIRIILPDIRGEKLVYSWDSNGNTVNLLYDELRRPVETRVKRKSDADYHLAEKTIYGESPPGITNPKKWHLKGQVWKVFDGAGMVTFENYDFEGNLLKSSRRLLKDPMNQVQWPLTGNSFDSNKAGLLLQKPGNKYSTNTRYNALGYVIQHTIPDGSFHRLSYNETGLMDSLSIERNGTVTDFITGIRYNAKGQRTEVQYSNGVSTSYHYDAKTYRLSNLKTLRKGTMSNKTLQDMFYTYDPAGNVNQIRDDAHPKIFNNNQVIQPVCDFTYDAIYRLIEATGREHESITNCHYQTTGQKHTEFIGYPQPVSNGQAIQTYLEKYTYDKSGNIRVIEHQNPGGTWKRNQQYQVNDYTLPEDQQIPVNNRLHSSKAGCPGESSFVYPYDNNGNILKVVHLPELIWNFKNQLTKVQLNAGTNPNKVFYQYDAAGQRVRKYIVKNNGTHIEERLYLGGYEIFTRSNNSGVQFERHTIHLMDDKERIALIEQEINTATGQVQNSRTRFQLSNHLGSSVLEVDGSPNAKVISYEEYYPYGGTAYIAGRNLTETKEKRYRYCGKERDDETGFYYYGARYYVPWLARWLSADPAGHLDGLNVYMFVRGSPVNMRDLNGFQGQPAENEANGNSANLNQILHNLAADLTRDLPGVTVRVVNENTVRVMLDDIQSIRDGIKAKQSEPNSCFVIDSAGINNYCRNNRDLCKSNGVRDKRARGRYRMITYLPELFPLQVEEFRLNGESGLEVDEVYQKEVFGVFAETILSGKPVLFGIQIPGYLHESYKNNKTINEGLTDHFPVGVGYEITFEQSNGSYSSAITKLFAVDNWVKPNELLVFNDEVNGRRAAISPGTRVHKKAQITHLRLWRSQISLLQSRKLNSFRNWFCIETRQERLDAGYKKFTSQTGRYYVQDGPVLPNGLLWCDKNGPLRLK